jgi:hypothetical protein
MNMVGCVASPSILGASRGRVIVGLGVMLVGTLLLADRVDWWGVRVNVPLWPWLLLFLGLARWAASSGTHHPVGRMAWWMIAIGTWGLLTEYHLFGFGGGNGWPLLVVLAGIFIIRGALDRPPHRRGGVERSGELS